MTITIIIISSSISSISSSSSSSIITYCGRDPHSVRANPHFGCGLRSKRNSFDEIHTPSEPTLTLKYGGTSYQDPANQDESTFRKHCTKKLGSAVRKSTLYIEDPL